MRTKEQRLQLYKSKIDRRGTELVKLIQDGWKSIQTTSLQVGIWLLELRDGDYWKKTHTTFNDFRDEMFGISERYGQFLIKGAETVKSLPTHLQREITTESQARALSIAPPEEREKIVEKLSKNGGVTAEKIEQLAAKKPEPKPAKEEKPKPNNCSGGDHANTESETPSKPKTPPKEKPKVELDENDYPIPDDALPNWEKSWGKEHEKDLKVQDILTQISRLKSVVVEGRKSGELRWLKVTNSIADTFGSLYSLISEAKPYAVCTTCMGSPSLQPDGCNFCKNTGLISEWQWNTQSRKEVKDMMLRRAEDLKKERENVH
jgi:hypothetical protein